MVLGVGIDLIDVRRIERSLTRQEGLAERLFCPGEIAYCQEKRYPYPHYAARFSAKEAFLKALGTGLRGRMNWLEMEVVLDELGRPTMEIRGECCAVLDRLGGRRVHLSLTHQQDNAAAVVIIED